MVLQACAELHCLPARAPARCGEAPDGWVWPPGEFTGGIGRSSADLFLSVQVRSG
jgi:hypothetical protein